MIPEQDYKVAEWELINWINNKLEVGFSTCEIVFILQFRIHDINVKAAKPLTPIEITPEDNDFDPRYDTNKEPGACE